jgi:ubiquinone/menaquinone biosynthesis C-methylase UbiE
MERDYWDELFDEMYLLTYAALDRGGPQEEEALAAARLAGQEPGADVLDAPCGYGRHSIPLAAAGFHVVGVDRSEVLLEEARRRAGEGEWPRWVHGDHRELPLEDASFDAVLCLFSSLGYRGEEGDERTLGEFHRVLRPGGRLVVETMHRDRLMHIFQSRGWDPLPNGATLIEERRFDYEEGVLESDHILIRPDGSRKAVTYRIRTYTATELGKLVAQAGFADLEYLGNLDGAELARETRLVIVARKPE